MFTLQEGGGKGVNQPSISVEIEGSWPCVSSEGSVGLTRRTPRRGRVCVTPKASECGRN